METYTLTHILIEGGAAGRLLNTVVNAIIAASPTITNTPNSYSPSGTYTLTASDFSSNGRTSWFGAMGYVAYLNSISYAGSTSWHLPTVATLTTGYNTSTNGTTKGDELAELYYQELGSKTVGNVQSGYGIVDPNNFFNNLQADGYWSGTEYAPDPDRAWGFDTYYGSQDYDVKNGRFYAWAVSPGQLSASPVSAVPVPAAAWLFGSGVLGLAGLRRRKQQA